MTQKSTKGKYRYVTDSKGNRHRIPVDSNGKVPFEYLEKFVAAKSPRSQSMDKTKVSRTVYPSQPEPTLAYQWMKNTGNSDISGLDSPKGTIVNYTEPVKHKSKKRTKSGQKKQSRPKAMASRPEPVKVNVGTMGLIPINRDVRLVDMNDTIVESNDGKVVFIEASPTPASTVGSIGAFNYSVYNRGQEYDGGRMEYDQEDTLRDLESFITDGKQGLGFRRVVVRAPSDEFAELSEALDLARAGEIQQYNLIKGKYALANKKPRYVNIKEIMMRKL